MKLSDWAKSQGINYQTAFLWFKKGQLPVPAYQTASGTIIVTPAQSCLLYTSNGFPLVRDRRR